MQLSYGTASHGRTVPGIDLTWASQSGRLGSDEAELGDHRLIAVCTVDTVTTLSAERATDPTTLCLLSWAAAQPTIISIFPRPARLVISANQEGRKVDNHIHIAASNSLPDTLRWTEHRNIIILKDFQQFQCSFLSSLWWHSCYSLNSKCLGCYLCINQLPVWSKLNYVKSSFSDLLFWNLPHCSSIQVQGRQLAEEPLGMMRKIQPRTRIVKYLWLLMNLNQLTGGRRTARCLEESRPSLWDWTRRRRSKQVNWYWYWR